MGQSYALDASMSMRVACTAVALSKAIKAHYAALGRKRAAALTPARRSEIARAAALARWAAPRRKRNGSA